MKFFSKSALLRATSLESAAIAVAVLGVATIATPATAQEAAAQPQAEQCADVNANEICDTEEEGAIIVTGSRIPRPEFEGTIPGGQVTAKQIEARAFTNTLDILNDLPIVGPGASPFGTNGGQPASLGASFVDLLDLGTQRTLTLVNGRRYVSANAASLFVQGNATGSQVDLNSIPTALIKNLDVLTVGGAVAYGSDAISGVVNAVLKDDYKGFDISALAGITEEGDGATYRLTAIAGMDFADGRGNITASIEYNRDDSLMGDRRPGIADNFTAPTSFRNGSVRNASFAPAFDLNVNGGQGAFLPSASDLVPNNIAGTGYKGGSIILTHGGSIFQMNGNLPFFPTTLASQGMLTTDPQSASLSPGFRAQALISQAGNTNLVPGTPIAGGNGCAVTNLTSFCNFAPSALPGTTGSAARATFTNAVLTRYAPTFVGTGTAAQRDALALQLLQANLPTPRDYLAANPNTDINLFLGTMIPNYLDVANTGPNAAVLPRLGVPLQFSRSGDVINPVAARITDPRVTPSTTGGAVGGDSYLNPADTTVLRVQQDRTIANLFGRFDLTPSVRLYTENLFARVISLAPRNAASSNTIGSTTTENVALLLDIANPYIDAADRAALIAAGIAPSGPGSRFVLSRTNQDILGDSPAKVTSETWRSVIGVKGDLNLFNNPWKWDASFTYGQAKTSGQSFQIKDIEYALAIDAVRDTSGNIVCRAQLNPASVLGQTPPGVVGLETVRVKQPDGTYKETQIRRVVTQDQINACKPLNLIGYDQMSQESKDYVTARTGFKNASKQYYGLATIGGTLFDLPGGPLGVAFTGEYRRESIHYTPDALSGIGATRTAALAETEGYIENWEFSAETRIPVFGDDFNIPLFRNLDLTPGVRFVKQSGGAPGVTLLNGTKINNQASGDWNTIYSLAGTWRPVEMLTLRGNYTRSIRQPSITELFLGGQPAFTGITDPCSSSQIGQGLTPATRRANCRAAAIAGGFATDATTADAFLNAYVPTGTAVTGFFSGSPGLSPERGESWTVGGVFAPTFIPGLTLSADYINVKVKNQIVPTTITTALQLCFDSPSFPDTTSTIGVNACNFFNRQGSTGLRPFEVDNGFNSGFINLGTLQVKALNASLEYKTSLDGVFGKNAGSIEFFTNVYRLFDYLSAPDGNLANALQSAGTLARPKWEVQARLRYENDGFFAQWTTNWQNKTKLFSSGAPVPGTDEQNEVQDLLGNPAFAVHDFSMGIAFGEQQRFRMQLTVRNVLDKYVTGPYEKVYAFNQGRIDDFGRRFVLSAGVKF